MIMSTMTVNGLGAQVWRNAEGQVHRDGDLPAIFYPASGGEYFYQYGKLHRDGGLPAIVWGDGTVEYWEHGVRIK